MGNVHAFAHRVTALSMACLASGGLILNALGGTSCSFLAVDATFGGNVMTPWGNEFVGQDLAYIGVRCESPFYEETDRMWNLSRLFFSISMGCGSLTMFMAWALSLFLPPSKCNWRMLSMLAACTAVMGVPVFLIFESEPCTMNIDRQTCSLALGSYFNIASVMFWVILTLLTQFLQPPNWSEEVNAWKTSKVNIKEITVPENGTNETDGSTGPNDFDGELFVTSNTLWTMNRGQNGTKVDGVSSDVSSISDGEKRGKEDIEAPADTTRRAKVEAHDHDIRRGASIVMNSLRGEKTKRPSDTKSTVAPGKLKSVPISSVAVADQETRGDEVFEMTGGLSEVKSGVVQGVQDPIYILRDLERSY